MGPIERLEIPYYIAADDAPLTRKSAPLISMTKPTSNKPNSINMGDEGLGVYLPKIAAIMDVQCLSDQIL